MYVIQYINRNMSYKIYSFKCKSYPMLLYYYILFTSKGTTTLKYTYKNMILTQPQSKLFFTYSVFADLPLDSRT